MLRGLSDLSGNLRITDQSWSRYRFANDTSLPRRNSYKALIPLNFQSGKELFSKSIVGPTEPTSSSADSSPSASSTPTASKTPVFARYPTPVVEHSEGMVAGYFLTGDDLSDVAVLNIPTFTGSGNAAYMEFQSVIKSFLKQSAKKKRLLIDVRGNNGGNPFSAYDAFKQLFPDLSTPYSGVRARSSDEANEIGSQIAQLDGHTAVQTALDVAADESPFNYINTLKSPDGKPFGSWPELYGPKVVNGDNFSAIGSWRFDNATYDMGAGGGVIVSGYANNTKVAPSPFNASNIVVLTDGACSSSCGIFVNLLVDQAGVKNVVVGGRPNGQAMALVGGTQGGEDLSFEFIHDYATAAIEISERVNGKGSEKATKTHKILDTLAGNAPLLPFPLSTPSVNFRDNIADGDKSMTPLQFTSRPADCRTYYTADDIIAVNRTWIRIMTGVAKSGDGLCINGTVSVWQGGSPTKATPQPSSSSAAAVVSIDLSWSAAWVGAFGIVFGLM